MRLLDQKLMLLKNLFWLLRIFDFFDAHVWNQQNLQTNWFI